MALDDRIIKIYWVDLCTQAFEQTNLSIRSKHGATPKNFPLDRVSLKQLLETLTKLSVSYDPETKFAEREVPEHSHCELCRGVKGQCNCPAILPTDKIIEIDGKRILTR